MNEAENDVIRRAAGGDEAAFSRLVTDYQTMVYNLALSLLRNREEALDVSQEVFLKAWRALPRYRFESAFSTWLYRLTKNTVLDHFRAQKRRPATVEQSEATGIFLREESESADLFSVLLARERRRLLTEALEELSEEHREVIRLTAFCGESYERTAQILGIEVGTVKSRLFRAKRELRKRLEKRNYF